LPTTTDAPSTKKKKRREKKKGKKERKEMKRNESKVRFGLYVYVLVGYWRDLT
jgi:hypothetical protein